MTKTVQAALSRGVGIPLEVRPIELVPTGPNQVLVRIVASGVCHSDLSVRNGSLPFMFPTVLGHEGSGVVEEVGSAVTRVEPGDHVVLTWIPACRRCFWCLAGQPMLCSEGLGEALGSPYATLDGEALVRGLGTATFAEKTVVPEGSVVRISPSLPLDEAALIGCALSTGVGAVWNTARVPPGSTVAVIGCGGIGLSALQGALLCGARAVVMVDRNEQRLDAARDMGATAVVDSSSADPVGAVRELTEGRGVDYAFEAVGLSQTIRQAFDMTRRGGTTVVVGAGSAADEVRFSAMDLFVDSKNLLGCVYGSTDPDRDFPMLAEHVSRGRIDAGSMVTKRIALGDIEDAFAAMEAGEVTRSIVTFEG